MEKMTIIPLPKGFDMSAHKEGETFDVTATVHITPHGLEVEAIDGMPVEMDESPAEEADETELDEEGLARAMGRGEPPAEEM